MSPHPDSDAPMGLRAGIEKHLAEVAAGTASPNRPIRVNLPPAPVLVYALAGFLACSGLSLLVSSVALLAWVVG